MNKTAATGLRVAGLMVMVLAIVQCGDNDVRVTTGTGTVPAAGTFRGTTSSGESITIQVGSIEAISFRCDGQQIAKTFDPPQSIESNGDFDVSFSTTGGRDFQVTGHFSDNNNVSGEIDDEDNRCDDTFDAVRIGGPAPTATVTQPGRTSTPTPALTPTGGVATATPTGDTVATATVTANPTAAPSPCPVGVEVTGNGGSAPVLDTGWTGLGHDATVVSDGMLTFNVACDTAQRPCGTCDVSGPIPNANADKGDINSQRCSNDTSVKCTSNAQCSGGGTCAFLFGAPLPLTAGGVSTCVVNEVQGTVSGTANIESGAFRTNLNLLSNVFTGIQTDRPCPQCVGDPTPNDGKAQGTCNEGPRKDLACDVNGKSPIPSFGDVSLDCPPNPGAKIASLPVALQGSSGTETRTLTASSPSCRAFGTTSFKCMCDAGGRGQPTAPNACTDLVCTATGGGEGACGDPEDQNCSIETFRGCTSNSDCPAPGDTCQTKKRECYLDNGIVGGSVTAQGKADPPVNGKSRPTMAALFCVDPTGSSAVNAAAGLPGLGRIQLPLLSQEILP